MKTLGVLLVLIVSLCLAGQAVAAEILVDVDTLHAAKYLNSVHLTWQATACDKDPAIQTQADCGKYYGEKCAKKYKVFISESPLMTSPLVITVDDTVYDHNALWDGKDYFYEVFAVCHGPN